MAVLLWRVQKSFLSFFIKPGEYTEMLDPQSTLEGGRNCVLVLAKKYRSSQSSSNISNNSEVRRTHKHGKWLTKKTWRQEDKRQQTFFFLGFLLSLLVIKSMGIFSSINLINPWSYSYRVILIWTTSYRSPVIDLFSLNWFQNQFIQ